MSRPGGLSAEDQAAMMKAQKDREEAIKRQQEAERQRQEQLRQQQEAARLAREQVKAQATTGAERTTERLREQASQERARRERSLQQRAAQAVPVQVFKETATVAQVNRSVSAAMNAIKQAESAAESWGSTITWGSQTYNLGTTEGYKEFKQAIRDAKSDVNQAKNTLRLYESEKWSAETGRKAKEVVDKANTVITRANKIIEEQNLNVEKIAEAYKKLIETKLAHDYKPKTKDEYYKDQTDTAYGWLTAFVLADVVDKEEAEKLVRQNAPNYLATAQNENKLEKWLEELDRLTKDAEGRADWKANEGKNYASRMDPKNRPTPQQIAARLEHTALSLTGGAIKAVPYVVLGTVGGPLVAGFIAASSVATFVDPKTRYETAVFIGEHPEEFFGSVAGALAAGMAVSKAQQMWGKYKTQLKVSDRLKLEKKWDQMIDDYTYLEQRLGSEFPSKVEKARLKAQYLRDYPDVFEKMIDDVTYSEQLKGAEFPSRVVEAPGDKPTVLTSPYGGWEEYVFKNFIKNMDGDDVAAFLKAKREGWPVFYDSGNQVLEPTFVDELISKYPELRDPFLHPAFTDPNVLAKSDLVARVTDVFKHPALMDPNVLNKADLVARMTSGNMAVSPLLSAALAIVAQQGYITDAQIKQLISSNAELLEAYKQAGIQVSTPWTLEDLKAIDLSEAAQAVSVIPAELADTITLQDTIQETIQIVEQVPVQGVDGVPVEPAPVEPVPVTPTEPVPTEKPPPRFIPRAEEEEEEKRRTMRWATKELGKFRVKFSYTGGSSQSLSVEASSYPEALNRAQRLRRSSREPPYAADVWKL